MSLLVFAFQEDEVWARSFCQSGGFGFGLLESRQFPDGESYLRLHSSPKNRDCAIVCSLHKPNPKIMPLLLLLNTLNELGAARRGLIAPYLCYLRQDKRFKEGEALSSGIFANMLGPALDWIITADPHLHRIPSLDKLYGIPSAIVHAAPAIATWIRDHVKMPLLFGPDSESRQWVSNLADLIKAPFEVLTKERFGDRDVRITAPNLGRWKAENKTPVLMDDIISTANTMIEAVKLLKRENLPPAICVGVHAIFAGDAWEDLKQAGAGQIITCDTVPHPSNQISLIPDFIASFHLLQKEVGK